MNASTFDITLILILGILGLVILIRSRSRGATDVLEDLREICEESYHKQGGTKIDLLRFNINTSKLSSSGLLELSRGSSGSKIRARVTPVIFAISALLIRLVISPISPAGSLLTILIGLSIGYLYEKTRVARLRNEARRAIDFYLPLVMERLVMAVQAGLDILPAIRSIIDSNNSSEDHTDSFDIPNTADPNLDSVSALLKVVLLLTESGISFEKSLEIVASHSNIPSLKHAFMHLSVAHKEGGELISPLRELSDATQLYYQESIEEEIAGMPVKATMPLLCTFAGLIICFLTSPIIQVIGFMSRGIAK